MKKELIFSATKKDFRVDTFRCGGPGGQNQNKRDTGVRITHIESGLSSECREHRTQKQNKKEAFRKLCDKLVKHYVKSDVKVDINTNVIRTYNEPDNRVVDHDTGKKFSYKETVGKEKLDELIEHRIKNVRR